MDLQWKGKTHKETKDLLYLFSFSNFSEAGSFFSLRYSAFPQKPSKLSLLEKQLSSLLSIEPIGPKQTKPSACLDRLSDFTTELNVGLLEKPHLGVPGTPSVLFC